MTHPWSTAIVLTTLLLFLIAIGYSIYVLVGVIQGQSFDARLAAAIAEWRATLPAWELKRSIYGADYSMIGEHMAFYVDEQECLAALSQEEAGWAPVQAWLEELRSYGITREASIPVYTCRHRWP